MKQAPTANVYRDTWCGDLRASHAGGEVRLAGWVHRRRDHGGLVFIDLRDRSGLVQLVFHPDTSGRGLRRRRGAAPRARPDRRRQRRRARARQRQPEHRHGEIEVHVTAAESLAIAETPPFPLDEDTEVDELLRLRHRALDLRREPMQRTIALRHKAIATMRRLLDERDFLEIETPILTRSTPEGARDFVVPNRREPGTWYALPQSPQLFKQLLMIAGYERYFQIARCFRDEDLRADRQPEFTQLDIEMAFVTEEEVIGLTEAVMSEVLGLADLGLPAPAWERVPYDEAMSRYGSDRPDRRFGLELVDVCDAVRGSEFGVFEKVLAARTARCWRSTPASSSSRARTSTGSTSSSSATAARRSPGRSSKGDGWRSPIAKFFSAEQIAAWTPRWAVRRATCCCSPPTSARSRRARSVACASSWPTSTTCAATRRTTSSGSSTSRCSSATPKAPRHPLHHPVHRADRRSRRRGGRARIPALARLRPDHGRHRARRRVDP
jgi:aspartyl-tRNA synthetase